MYLLFFFCSGGEGFCQEDVYPAKRIGLNFGRGGLEILISVSQEGSELRLLSNLQPNSRRLFHKSRAFSVLHASLILQGTSISAGIFASGSGFFWKIEDDVEIVRQNHEKDLRTDGDCIIRKHLEEHQEMASLLFQLLGFSYSLDIWGKI